MPFPETLKLLVRRRAHFRCCVCRSVGVEIHHIVPQEESGPDTEDNAAPLCPSCHELYGANPTKRKFIREARDFWFETCASTQVTTGLTLSQLTSTFDSLASKNDIADLKALIETALDRGVSEPAGAISTSEEFNPIALERFIHSLYEEDFGPTPAMYEMFFDSRSWYEDADDTYDLLDRRALFLREYGEQTARRICLIACRDAGCDPKGFTEEDLAKAMGGVRSLVVLITGHEKHSQLVDSFQCAQRADGEFLWRLVPRKKSRSRKPSPTRRIKG